MKNKRSKLIDILVFGTVALCFITPVFLIIALPLVIIWFIYYLIERQKAETTKQLYDNLDRYLQRLDKGSLEFFQSNVLRLIEKATNNGYESNAYMILNKPESTIKYYKSEENIGIAILRKSFGTEHTSDCLIITNQHLTTEAEDFCKNNHISVIDRNLIADMYALNFNIEHKAKIDLKNDKVNKERYIQAQFLADETSICPECGSHDLSFGRKGYDWNYAFWGSMFKMRGSQYIAGMDSRRVIAHCNKCGHSWKTSREWLR